MAEQREQTMIHTLAQQVAICEENGAKWIHCETADIRELLTLAAPRQSEQWMKEAAREILEEHVYSSYEEGLAGTAAIIAKHAPKEPTAPTEETK